MVRCKSREKRRWTGSRRRREGGDGKRRRWGKEGKNLQGRDEEIRRKRV
jgi:hypothetical protein